MNAFTVKTTVTFILIILSGIEVFAQTDFAINGASDFYDGKELIIETYPKFTGDAEFSGTYFKNTSSPSFHTVKVANRAFFTEGKTTYPTPCVASYYDDDKKSRYTSRIFFLSEGTTNLAVNDLRVLDNIAIENASVHEKELTEIFRRIKDFYIYEKDIPYINQQQRILESYIIKNPNSYVAMWLVYIHFKSVGYLPQLQKNASIFSEKVRQVEPFAEMIKRLEIQSDVKNSGSFPFAEYGSQAQEFREQVATNKYTLIDYWATWCGPCIAQFPTLTQFYDKYNATGFGILSVSADGKQNTSRVTDLLKQKNVKWHNYVDYDLSVGSKIGVTALPTNFLLDSKGKVLFKNISLEDLEQLLLSEL